jgi:hypothetical protein
MFSMDLLIAAVIVIMAFGLITAAAEMNFYNKKQEQLYEIMKQKTQAAAIALANSPQYDCNIGELELSYSIDIKKIKAISKADLKKRLGLTNYNARITLTDKDGATILQILDEPLSGENVSTIEISVAACSESPRPTYADFEGCTRTAPDADCTSTSFLQYKLIVGASK